MTEMRIVITGIGLSTPIGTGVDTFWKAALAGTNGIRPIASFDTTDFKTKTGGEAIDFNPASFIDKEKIGRMGRGSQLAVAAAKMAVRDSGLNLSALDPYRLGVSVGTTMGEPQILEQSINIKYKSSSLDAVPADLPRQYPCGAIPANIAREFNIKGPVIIIPTACAAGNYAIGYAYDLIQLGRVDAVICGGSDPFSRIAFTGFNRLLATTDAVCRPFSKNRDGMAVAEGAGMMVIEPLEAARRRNAPIYAEILGYGLACDAFKMTIPDPDGTGGIMSLQRALKHAHISPDKIDYINAHGTGTKENDKVETFIVKQVLGDHAKKCPITSLKSMLGHTMGAASAIEAVASALMIKNKTILPTINYDEPDPECDLDYVPNVPREADLNVVVSNAYAFGGNTSSLVLGKFRG
jgi:3-oxoacyl-[acyl-carrier-protein] synthase II